MGAQPRDMANPMMRQRFLPGFPEGAQRIGDMVSMQELNGQVTASMRHKDGYAIHIRKNTVAEPALMKIYKALKINPTPGGTKKRIV